MQNDSPSGRIRRWRTLVALERRLEPAMVALGFAWLLLLILEFTGSTNVWLQRLSTTIWIVFVVDFGVRLTLAPRRALYLRRNWLTLFALALPALRIFRVFRVLGLLRYTRGLRFARLLTSVNRSSKALGKAMRRRGAGYAVVLTVLVVAAGAAGMYAFESHPPEPGFEGYLDALWWTAMIVTTIGSEYWPQTTEGRVLCLLLSIYSVAVVGYLAGVLASFFIGQDAARSRGDVAGEASVESLRQEIAALRKEIADSDDRRNRMK